MLRCSCAALRAWMRTGLSQEEPPTVGNPSSSKRRRVGRVVVGAFVLKALAVSLWGCDPFNTQFDDIEPAIAYEAAKKSEAPAPAEGRLVVMNYNVKFGGARIDFFFDCHGDRVVMSREEVLGNLDGLVAKIRQVNPDILMLQEVDIDSKRAAYVDQMQYLLDQTELNYGVYASQWKADYVPSNGIGRVNSGSGILSRWPLQEGTRIALPLMEQDKLTQYFYLKRNILRVKAEIPGREPLYVLNIHTDAYSRDGAKKKQLDRLLDEIDQLQTEGFKFVAGGDFNTLPPGSPRLKDFEDSVCEDEDFQADDFSQETAYLEPFYARYASAIPLADYQAHPERYYTHSTTSKAAWNRTLDYLFTNAQWLEGSGMVHQSVERGGMDTMALSDHAPVTATLVLEAP